MFGSLGIWEILLIFLIVMLIFGSKKLPEIGKGLGKAITNFKRSMKDQPEQVEEGEEEEEASAPAAKKLKK